MDNQMLSVHITLITDTLYHIDVALTIILICMAIVAALGLVFLLSWLVMHLGGGDDDE